VNSSFFLLWYPSYFNKIHWRIADKFLIFAAKKEEMLDKLMSQMGPMKEAMEQAKKKLDTITAKGEADGGQVIVYVNGNRRVTEIKISQSLMDEGDKEAIEELMQVALNKALASADNINEMENASAMRNLMPGMF